MPLMTAKMPVMVRVVVSSGAQVERWRRCTVSTMGCLARFSTVQNAKNATAATAASAMARIRVPASKAADQLGAFVQGGEQGADGDHDEEHAQPVHGGAGGGLAFAGQDGDQDGGYEGQ